MGMELDKAEQVRKHLGGTIPVFGAQGLGCLMCGEGMLS